MKLLNDDGPPVPVPLLSKLARELEFEPESRRRFEIVRSSDVDPDKDGLWPWLMLRVVCERRMFEE